MKESRQPQVRPLNVLLLLRSSVPPQDGSSVLQAVEDLKQYVQSIISPPVRFLRRLCLSPNYGPDWIPWERRLPELEQRGLDIVAVEDLTRVSRNPDDQDAFVETLRTRGIRLLIQAPNDRITEGGDGLPQY
ncbi:hypothetical protein VT03_05695 [Planctomyces sp. SH-PL14]|nr:hypothetical protein VT03_05695 [Planctomyces sp. SH-PL14]